ncbi:catechol 2,3-dioxygenase-like lactoylglutathione lyase family enzyme [Amycolatopsis endophytica]|uniref:Catechol 2,3-dioxygenase-like lactoylglutathione lyase family enzyme n=1 Tax=Amycolatopsis endophytica TaxID=860233 RepID=A0A853BAY4_9PSEU|nr:VOC family protein [Amycolatopsis endophytica]NYI91847.1 catechol 2,3-dioxygenase-like lactoylglutathione lyase family enzyme [Amycolatopsis endophytica]
MGLGVPDFREAVEFYRSAWGLQVVDEDSDVVFFGTPANPEAYIVRVRKDPAKRVDLIAFAAESASAVDELAQRLGSAGITLVREPDKLGTPGGGYGFRFFDPDGRLIEVSSDVAPRPWRALEPRESVPQKLSHVVVNSPDVVATKRFYETHLGFRLSDWLEDKMCFMRVRSDHHILAIAQGPHTSLNHVSFEMRGLDEFMRGTGRLIRQGRDPVWGPGRHSAGDNTFSYFTDPVGNVVEYTTELERIDDDEAWEPRTFSAAPEVADQWGTGGPFEPMIPAMHNSPDQGLWTPAPL